MRPSLCRSCLAFLLKFLNFLQAFVGVAIVVYSIWMLTQWNGRDPGISRSLGLDAGTLPGPWFVYLFMGIGGLVCLITFTGHVAVEATALVGIMVLNKHWEEELPHDPTGELDKLRKFVEANIDICRWIGVVVIVIQALSLLLAVILRGMVSTRALHYDSDDDLLVARAPLLYPHYSSTSTSTAMDGKIHSDIWSARMREKYGLNQCEYSIPVDTKPSPSGNLNGEDQRVCSIL